MREAALGDPVWGETSGRAEQLGRGRIGRFLHGGCGPGEPGGDAQRQALQARGQVRGPHLLGGVLGQAGSGTDQGDVGGGKAHDGSLGTAGKPPTAVLHDQVFCLQRFTPDAASRSAPDPPKKLPEKTRGRPSWMDGRPC